MKNKRGITLIALILTIVVMSILAGVSLNALVGDNGILTSAKNSKMKYQEERAKEELEMAWAARMSKYLEDITNPPIFIDEKELAELMKQLNTELAGKGSIEGISWNDKDNNYSILFRNNTGQLFFMSVSPKGNVGERAIQGNSNKNVADVMYSATNYIVNENNVEEKVNIVRNNNIYAFLYEQIDNIGYYTLVFNNENVGVNDSNYRFIDSWNNIDDNFNFRHDATQERIDEELYYESLESEVEVDVDKYILWKDYTDYIDTIEILNPIYPEHLDYFFAYMALEEIKNIENLITTNTVSMKGMFEGTYIIDYNLDVSNFKTTKVTDMSYMFYNFDITMTESEDDIVLDLSSFNTSKVTDMSYMFAQCIYLNSIEVSSFNTSNVTNMDSMFWQCENLIDLDVSNFNTSNVNNMSWMFSECKNLISLEVSNFDTSNVTDMDSMFYDCEGLTTLDLRNFSLASITSLDGISDMFMNSVYLETVIVSESFRFETEEEYYYGDILKGTATNYELTLPVLFEGNEVMIRVDVDNFFNREYDYTDFL